MSQSNLIEHDVACIFCGYNLQSLATDGVCPECGSSVAQTLKLTGQLGGRDQIVRLRRAVRWLGWIPLLGIAIAIALSYFPPSRSIEVYSLPIVMFIGLGIGYFVAFISFAKHTEELIRTEKAPFWKSLCFGAVSLIAFAVSIMPYPNASVTLIPIVGGLICVCIALVLRRSISIYECLGRMAPKKNCLAVIWCLNLLILSLLFLLFGEHLILMIPNRTATTDDSIFFVVFGVMVPFLPVAAIAGYLVLIIRLSTVLRRALRPTIP